MKSIVCFATALLAIALCLGVVNASGPIGVYALVDKVAFEPSADKPQRIRISGVFITAEERSDVYSAPQRGYLYFALPRGNDELSPREWADLKSVAGTRQVVGLGSSWSAKVRVRKPEEETKSPDDYPGGNGLVKVNPDQPRAKALLEYKDR
ncbi:MAG TPA: hypothetical protein VNY05_09275 [Candidatus Acidoferrales bacterium]|jgi:hypothetical protein|nr:hypothetical protein [Candidatus Acidoferrales bacterium]